LEKSRQGSDWPGSCSRLPAGKFALGNHVWDEPLELITENNKNENLNIITPMIGEKVDLDDQGQVFSQWWKGVDRGL